MTLTRTRPEKDGTETQFALAHYGGDFPFIAEVRFSSVEELRQLKRENRLHSIRMQETAPEEGCRPQRNLVGVRHIKGL